MNQTQSDSRRVVILRHGERVDFKCGNSWTETAFDATENYVRTDSNMPETLPARPAKEWKHDSPLTILGESQAQMVGESLKAGNVKFSNVFVSPSYRSMKTAANVLKAMGVETELPINIEPGLFEWLGFVVRWGLPSWMPVEDFSKLFNVNRSYEPVIGRKKLEASMRETIENYYDRSSRLMREILKTTEGDIMIVGHGMSLDTCTRQLTGKQPRTWYGVLAIIHRIPYLAAITMEQTGESTYRLVDSTWANTANDSLKFFDWRILE